VFEENELLPYSRVMEELVALCSDRNSGNFNLFTDQKHAAVITLEKGDIVGLRYRISQGLEAVNQIKEIIKAKVRFVQGDDNNITQPNIALPPTEDLLKRLGVSLAGAVLQGVGKKIMVVEDSGTQRKAIVRMLVSAGYRTLEAHDGLSALAALGVEKPEMILLDIVMPGIDGYQVLETIREKAGFENTPVIMLTSRDGLFDKVRGRMSGSNEYLTKPFKQDELMAKVNKYLRS